LLISGQMQGMMSQGDPGSARFTDPTGLINVFAGMPKAGKDSSPAFTGGLVIGSTPVSRIGGLHTFVWQGVRWDATMLLGRLLWLALGLLMACLAALPFDRFDPTREKLVQRKGGKQNAPKVDELEEDESQPSAGAAGLSPQHLAPARYMGGLSAWIALLISNLRLIVKGLPWWWYAVFAGLWVATLFSPLQISRSTWLPLIWLWPILLWSSLGCREKIYRTGQLLFSTPSPLTGQTLAAWSAGLLLALGAGSGAAVRMLLDGQSILLVSLLAGALFIPSMALALGSWTGSSKAFEVIYVVLWYLGPINHLTALDYIGTADLGGLTWLYLLLSLGLLAIGLAGRWKQIREVQ
jgi:hypothetical protein